MKTYDLKTRLSIKAELDAHIAHYRRERMAYYEKRLMAQLNSDEFMSLIIDGADQGRHMFPHFHIKVSKSKKKKQREVMCTPS